MAVNGKRGSRHVMNRIKLYVVEEQELFCQAYQATFSAEPTIDLVGIVGEIDGQAIASAVTALRPDVVLLGTKTLCTDIVEKLEVIRRHNPDVGIVLLAALYDVKAVKQLRGFARRRSQGCAFLLKHSIDRTDQMVRVIRAVVEGRVIIDPLVKEGLFGVSDPRIAYLNDLTHQELDGLHRMEHVRADCLKGLTRRELEVLSWMAKELRNTAIADVLCVDPRTVKSHINAIYRKLSRGVDSGHPRISAITLYLTAIGQLSGNESRGGSLLPFGDRRGYSMPCRS